MSSYPFKHDLSLPEKLRRYVALYMLEWRLPARITGSCCMLRKRKYYTSNGPGAAVARRGDFAVYPAELITSAGPLFGVYAQLHTTLTLTFHKYVYEATRKVKR